MHSKKIKWSSILFHLSIHVTELKTEQHKISGFQNYNFNTPLSYELENIHTLKSNGVNKKRDLSKRLVLKMLHIKQDITEERQKVHSVLKQ